MLKLTEGSQKVQKLEKPEHKITFIQKVIKGETYMVMAQSKVELEDEFSSLYFTASNQSNLFLMPPFEPNVLLNLVQTNNVLNQCIEAMEVNIDGTGHEFVAAEKDQEINKKEEDAAKAFFNEPYPNMSLVAIRRKLRRQMESVGYGFIEVLRNVAGEIVGLRSVETAHVRMVKLDKPIQVKKKIERGGKEVELTIWMRERRFAQTVALKQQVYYREYGTTRQIDRDTGNWEEKDSPIPPDKRGTELMIFGIHPDTTTPYYLPRWINQLPSVIGSRSAEEQNLEFLDAGGLPPAIVFIQGGTIIKDVADQLKMYLSGLNKNKNRACVVEVQSSSGSLDSQAKVDVKTERFGSAASQDAMFEQYDETTGEHVREGFRLPPLFLGKAADYNFATAQTAYMVAEAQVFLPERTEFDEVMNKTVIKEMGWKTLKFKSKPITLKDVASQLKGLEIGKDAVTKESFVDQMNQITDMTLEMAETPAMQAPGENDEPLKNTPTADEMNSGELPASITDIKPTPKPEREPEATPNEKAMEELKVEEQFLKNRQLANPEKKKKAAIELIELAHDYATLKGLVRKRDLSPEKALVVQEAVANLVSEDMDAFNRLIATYAFGADEPDLVHIAGCTH